MSHRSAAEASQYLWRELLQDEDCVAWVGSGLSLLAEYANWDDAVKSVCCACGIDPPSSGASVKEKLRKAEESKERDPQQYQQVLVELYGKRQDVLDRQAYNYLWGLQLPAYVTTNFDPLLYHRAISHGNERCIYPNELRASSLGTPQPTLYHIHGLAVEDDPQFVFSESEFETAYGDPGPVSNFLETLFTEHNLLFLGCQLEEPALGPVLNRADSILQFIQQHRPESVGRRKRLLLKAVPMRDTPDPAREERVIDVEKQAAKEEELQELGVKVVWYRAENPSVRYEIEEILSNVCRYKEMATEAERG